MAATSSDTAGGTVSRRNLLVSATVAAEAAGLGVAATPKSAQAASGWGDRDTYVGTESPHPIVGLRTGVLST